MYAALRQKFLDYLRTLILAKASGEHTRMPSVPDAPGREVIEADLARLHEVLDEAAIGSTLPNRPTAEPALHDLTVRSRMAP